MKLVILIPAFNEADSIAATLERIPDRINGISDITTLVVNDGSIDDTASISQANGAKVISHPVNKGVGAGFNSGLKWAIENGADILVNIDADGQFNPDDIEKLITPLLRNTADMVAADRFSRGKPANMSSVKYYGNKLMSFLISILLGQKFKDVSCGFRSYNKEALLNLNLIGKFTYTQESFIDLTMKGLRIVQIPVEVKYFKKRKSRVFKGVFNYALNSSLIIFKVFRDYKPLLFFGSMGAFLLLIGLALDAFTIVHYLVASKFTPYISVAFAGAYFTTIGLGIIVLGLIADMFDRVRFTLEQTLYYQKASYYESRKNRK